MPNSPHTLTLDAARALVVDGRPLGERTVPELRKLRRWARETAYQEVGASDGMLTPSLRRGLTRLEEISAGCDVLLAHAERDQGSLFEGVPRAS